MAKKKPASKTKKPAARRPKKSGDRPLHEEITFRDVNGEEITTDVISVDRVVRDLIRQGQGSYGYDLKAYARRLGLPYSTLHSFMEGETVNGALRLLTHLAGAEGMSPVEALRYHPALHIQDESAITKSLLGSIAADLTTSQLSQIAYLTVVYARAGVTQAQLDAAMPIADALAEQYGVKFRDGSPLKIRRQTKKKAGRR